MKKPTHRKEIAELAIWFDQMLKKIHSDNTISIQDMFDNM